MCGICAYIGYNSGYIHVINGLLMLQNRGYDSAGICSINDQGKLVVSKYASTIDKTGIDLIMEHKDLHSDSNIFALHSRWATHGSKTDENAHPHACYQNKFVVVHNGIIENYAEIKRELMDKYNIEFKSQTDTEVIVNLISVCWNKLKNTEESIQYALQKLQGTWGLVIINVDEPNKLYCARHGSPLLIGFGEDYAMVASEQSGFCKYVNNYICLKDHDIVILEKCDGKIKFHKQREYEVRKITVEIGSLTPAPYPHWTIKEINEQYDSSKRAMCMGGRILNDHEVKLGGLTDHINHLIDVDNLIILGCGTSYHAGLYCMNLFKKISGFNTVTIYDGAEFSKYDIPKLGKTALLFLSQSGETKDLHRSLEIGKDDNLYMIGVVNVVDSLIAREVQCGVYLNAGKEVGVASTKAFTSQVIVLSMISVWFAQIRNINVCERIEIIKGLRKLPLDIKNTIDTIGEYCKDVAKYLLDKNSVFVLGKDICESVAKEGSLKIKEIGYIHAEGYSSSALKHGPYSLINPGSPIIIVACDDEFLSKNLNIIEEVKSRHAFIVVITDKNLKDTKYDINIKIKQNYPFRGLLSAIPMQLIAYELACMKGHDPDLPQNLAKTVSVD